MAPTVTATISTKNRYQTTLPMAIASIINQTVKPNDFILFDDGEHRDLREDPTYRPLLHLMNEKGIKWSVVFGQRKGQVLNHQKAIDMAQTEWIWRVDDDDVAEPDALAKLLRHTVDGVGGIGSLVLTPGNTSLYTGYGSSQIEDIYTQPNIQWFRQTGVKEVDHFNNTFLFRKEAANHGYCTELSSVGHREETIFSYGIKRAGWKLLLEPEAVVWHFADPQGGIRSNDIYRKQNFEADEQVFSRYLAEWGVKPKEPFLVVLNGGIGDHFAFKMSLDRLKAKHANKRIILAVCYPEVFADVTGVQLVSIADAMSMKADLAKYDIYQWMAEHNWTDRLHKAFEAMYGLTQ